ncbi:MAG TPA: phytoene/squalene synthase family protein [Chitinophagaceae bacterium]|nr:phytoene/squalene synthase family protein [Chitinophagaceae bacterium]
MMDLFDRLSIRCSRITTEMYSTSFCIGINCLQQKLRDPIYAIYGFVRFADEIVDTFHDFDKEDLLQQFKKDTFSAIEKKISLNPILHSFQSTVNQYKIEKELIIMFLKSMEMDLKKSRYNADEIQEYIVGSAEVVGLMCLRVFCDGNNHLYHRLAPYARSLGSAFQKVNFLRDLDADYNGLGRSYFPGIVMDQWDASCKTNIEKNIAADFNEALIGIKLLPKSARFGVYVAYIYYMSLFKKIKNTPPELILAKRIRIANGVKARLLAYSFLKHQFNLL